MLPVCPHNHETKQRLSQQFLFRTQTQAERQGIQTEGSLPFTQKSSTLSSQFSLRPLTTQYAVTVATLWQTSRLLDILPCQSAADVGFLSLLFLLQMPDCWLEVSIRKVVRPATSTQVFCWFPCVYKQMLRCFPRFPVATTCFSCNPPDLNLLVTNFMFCIHVK